MNENKTNIKRVITIYLKKGGVYNDMAVDC